MCGMGAWNHVDTRTRNGGVTWRPYSFLDPSFNAFNAATWPATASDWGGDIHLDSEIGSAALFAQDYIAIGPRLTVMPGLVPRLAVDLDLLALLDVQRFAGFVVLQR